MNNEARRLFMRMIVMAAAAAAKPLAACAEHSAAEETTVLRVHNQNDPGKAAGSCTAGLVEKARALLGSLQNAELDTFLEDWPVTRSTRNVVPSSLPVLRWLPDVKASAPAFSIALVSELCRVARCMEWRQTYKVPDVDAEFLENYGWSEIVGLRGELASTRIACGFLLLGPDTHYPRHRHEAEEIYLPLAGTASWQRGDGLWRAQLPGTVIHHASEEPHAMRTDKQPLLAVYLWSSANLNQKSHLDPTGT